MDTSVAQNTGGGVAPPGDAQVVQQLHDSLLHELRGEMQASHQQLVAEIQQLFTQHAVVSTATPVAAVAPAAAPVQVLPASPSAADGRVL